MTRLWDLNKDVWSILVQLFESLDSFTLFATGCHSIRSKVVESVSSISVGLVPIDFALQISQLRMLSLKQDLPDMKVDLLSSLHHLTDLELPQSMTIKASIISSLPNLTHFRGGLDSFDFLLENSKAPFELIHLFPTPYSVAKLNSLPSTLTSLVLPPAHPGETLQKPLPSSITFLEAPSDILNIDLPLLGLPTKLTMLKMAIKENMARSILETIQPMPISVFESNHCLVTSDLAKSLPSSIKTLAGIHLTLPDDVGFASLPPGTTFLKCTLVQAITPVIEALPVHLSVVSIGGKVVFNDDTLSLLPTTVTDLELPNGVFTGKAVLNLPPHLKRISILEENVDSSFAPTNQQPWYPFFVDPEYIARLPLSLDHVSAHLYSKLPSILLDRLSNGVKSWTSPIAKTPERILNVLLDLREIVSTFDAKIMIEDMRRRIFSAICKSQDCQNREPPCRMNFYTFYPQTLEYSDGVVNSTGQVLDTRIFMTRVQGLYNMLTEEVDSEKRFHETHLILLPCASISKLRDIDVVFISHRNKRLEALFPSPTQILTFDAKSGPGIPRSSFVVRLSLDSFKLYDGVAVGGTFDYMHTGHRMLLSTCLLSAKKRLVIGVTGPALLVKKAHKDYIQAFRTRCQNVILYCKLQRPDLQLDVAELLEPAGPTAVEPNLDLLVVSEETASGIALINDIRAKKGFKPMEGLIVHLASSYGKMKAISQDAKLSSTTIRLRQKQLDEYLYGHNAFATPPPYVQPNAEATDDF